MRGNRKIGTIRNVTFDDRNKFLQGDFSAGGFKHRTNQLPFAGRLRNS